MPCGFIAKGMPSRPKTLRTRGAAAGGERNTTAIVSRMYACVRTIPLGQQPLDPHADPLELPHFAHRGQDLQAVGLRGRLGLGGRLE